MEKEGILSELKTRIGNPELASKLSNISERTVTEYVDKLYPTLGESFEPTDEFYTAHLGILETVAGNIRFSASSAVDEYKKSSKPIDSKTESLSKPTDGNSDFAELLKSMATQLEDLKSDLDTSKQTTLLKQKTSDARTKLETLGANNSEVLDIAFSLAKYDSTKSTDEIAALVKTEYDSRYTKLFGKGYAPSGNGDAMSTNSFKSYKEQKIKEGKLPS